MSGTGLWNTGFWIAPFWVGCDAILWPLDLCSSFFSEAAHAMLAKLKSVIGTIKRSFVTTEIFMVLTLFDSCMLRNNPMGLLNMATEVQEVCRVRVLLDAPLVYGINESQRNEQDNTPFG